MTPIPQRPGTPVLILTYDLNRERKSKADYNEFYKVRDAYDYIKLSESSYALCTAETPENVWRKLQPHADPDDTVLVIHLRPSYAGQGTQSQVEWLAQRLSR